MATKWLALALLAAFCAVVQAQTVVNLTGTVADTEAQLFLLEVDHGSTPTAINVTLDLTTPGTSGLSANLGDFDMVLGQLAGGEQSDAVAGPGTIVLQLDLPARAGVFQVFVRLETASAGAASPFSGTATVSAGSIIVADTATNPDNLSGVRATFGRVIEHARETSAAGTFWMDFTLDFGPTAHSTTILVAAGTLPGTSVRLLDMSSDPTVELEAATSATPTLLINQWWHVTQAYSGVVRFRVEFTKTSGDGGVASQVVLPSDVTLLSATDSLTPRPSGGGGGDDDGCVAGPAGHLGIFALLPALAIVRRRRRS